MPSRKTDELRGWLAQFESDARRHPLHAKLHDTISATLDAVLEIPDSYYREQALCKLTDAAAFTFVASKQPEPPKEASS